jgi:hypothetical protein
VIIIAMEVLLAGTLMPPQSYYVRGMGYRR